MARRTVFTMGELAERTGVDQQSLERWVELGLLPGGGKGSNGTRFYTEEAVARTEHIRRLEAMGYAEAEVGKILRKVGLPGGQTGDAGSAGDEDLLTVGALAESVGVSPRTIKHWEDKGIIEADARSEGGFRLYKDHYVYLCHLIQDLQLFGYSLGEIKEISDYFRDFVVMREELSSYSATEAGGRLTGMLGEIDRLFETTRKLRDGIERWEKLLNRHRRLVVELKKANDKREARGE